MAGFDDCVLYLSVSLIEMVCISDDVDLKPEGVFISPPPSDSGSSSPQLSPYCIDSEPGSPLLEHETVRHADPAPSINFQNRAQTPPPHFIFTSEHRLHPLTSYLHQSTDSTPSLHIYIRAQTPPPHFIFTSEHILHPLTSYANQSTDSTPSLHIYIRAQTPPLTSYSNNSTESAPSFHIQIRARASV